LHLSNRSKIVFETSISDDSLKSIFPLHWWEGIKGRGKIVGGKYPFYSPPP
jgi:hypothetical protein